MHCSHGLRSNAQASLYYRLTFHLVNHRTHINARAITKLWGRAKGPELSLLVSPDWSHEEVRMENIAIDRAGMERLAKALVFICGADHPTTLALKAAAESGSERDIKKARSLFLRLKPGDRQAALVMIND